MSSNVGTHAHVRGLLRAGMLSLVLATAACSPAGFSARGLSPVMDARDVVHASNDRQLIMAALEADASFGESGPTDWYEVTLAGFNYVDDRCAQYFDSLFKLNREKESLKSGLSAFGQTTNAILSITGAATLTMNVVAQAFGLASNLTDIIAGTYLFELPPATTLKFVDETMHAYKDGVAKASGRISSPAAAYGYVRGYLNLCLPATIEGKLVDHVGGIRAVADGGGTGADMAVRVVSDISMFDVQQLRDPGGANNALPQGSRITLPTTFEKIVTAPEWAGIQRALCITVDGTIGQNTRKAITEFYRGRGVDRPDIMITGVLEPDFTELQETVRLSANKTCTERGYTTAFEVGSFSH